MSRKAVALGERMVSTRRSRWRVESPPYARLCVRTCPLPGPQEGRAQVWLNSGGNGGGRGGVGCVGQGGSWQAGYVFFPWPGSLLSAGGLKIPKWVHHDAL